MRQAEVAARLAVIGAEVIALGRALAGMDPVVPFPAPGGLPVPFPGPSAMSRFDACMVTIFENEGGYVNHPEDDGGPTNLGITMATLGEWRGQDVTVADVRGLQKAEARQIFHANYWTKNRCDQMAPGVDLAVLDFTVNSGRAIKVLQSVLGVSADNAVGPLTLAAIAQYEPEDMVQRVCDVRLAYVKGLSDWRTFGDGWLKRIEKVRRLAAAMAKATRAAA